MMRRMLLSAVVLLVVVGVAAALSLISPMRRPAPAAVDLPRAAKLTCVLPGTLTSAGAVGTVTPVDGGTGQDLAPATGLEISGPVNVRADGDVAAGVVTAGTPGVYAPCDSPTTTGVLLVDDPASAELLLTNADSAETNVDLRLLGPAGELEPVGARGIAIAPGVTRPIALSVLAPEGPVAVVYTASQGRVAAMVRNVEGRPARVVAAGALRAEHLITGIPAGASVVKLLLTNPTENRATVAVSAMGPSGTYSPASTSNITLAPMTSQAIDVGVDLSGEASALKVSADHEVGASVVTTVGTGAPASLRDAAAVTELMAAGQSLGSIVLTNPGEAAATATLTYAEGSDATVTIPAGATVAVEPPADATQVQVAAEQPLVGALSVRGETGQLIVPLEPAAGAPARPGLTELDPGLR